MPADKDYLADYSLADYERPSVTTDIVTFIIRSRDLGSYRRDPESVLSLLLVKRGIPPFKSCWALPGGFLQPGETVEECALREITEETGITPEVLIPAGVFSETGRDPRGWIISNAFTSVLNNENTVAKGGDDAADARWFDVHFEKTGENGYTLTLTDGETELCASLEKKDSRFGITQYEITDRGGLAFDHAKIIAAALEMLRSRAKKFEIIFDFLPESFTLTSLQRVQEVILNKKVLPANFRRKIADYVEETDEYSSGAGHRPAKLFKKKDE